MSHMNILAGKPTAVGDEIYHAGLALWCKVTEPGIVTINGVNGQKVKYAFSDNGKINGRKMLYWHMPLRFESSSRDVTKYQALLDAAYTNFGA